MLGPDTYDVPEEVGQPVDGGTHSTDKLEVLSFVHPLLDQIKDKAGRDEGHGKDHTDGHHSIHRSGQPAEGRETEGERGGGAEAGEEQSQALGSPHQCQGTASRIPFPSLKLVISLSCVNQTGSKVNGYLCISCSTLMLNIKVNIKYCPLLIQKSRYIFLLHFLIIC